MSKTIGKRSLAKAIRRRGSRLLYDLAIEKPASGDRQAANGIGPSAIADYIMQIYQLGIYIQHTKATTRRQRTLFQRHRRLVGELVASLYDISSRPMPQTVTASRSTESTPNGIVVVLMILMPILYEDHCLGFRRHARLSRR